MYFHAVAILAGGKKKTLVNKTEKTMLTDVVIPYKSTGVIEARWGESRQSYHVRDLFIYRTPKSWDKKSGIPLEKFTHRSRNIFKRFEAQASKALKVSGPRVFIIMPIQGEEYGSQSEQRIFEEYSERFEVLQKLLAKFGCVAIRIDKEQPLEELVKSIKTEIEKCQFAIADLTDERQSCYFEAGYAEAKGKYVIYAASKESIMNPGQKTTIHFDIHRNVHWFSHRKELKKKINGVIVKNKIKLLGNRV